MLMDNQSLQKGAPPVWNMIPSLQPLVEGLSPVFTQPSFHTCSQLLLGWVMCLGKHNLWRVGHSVDPRQAPDHSQRHDLDTYYNFFARSAWTTKDLAYRVALLVITRLKPFGCITLLVDDTLTHKRGNKVWGMGWFRDGRRQHTPPGGHRFGAQLGFAGRGRLCSLHLLPDPGPAHPGALALARKRSAQLRRPDQRDAGRSAGVVPQPQLYACRRWRLRLQGTAG